ncbi:MAG: hypothetical protein KAY46_22270 [Burkholderiaceae bacterium]|nr:hypothetical protein [Burkholderiaceae bacterium]
MSSTGAEAAGNVINEGLGRGPFGRAISARDGQVSTAAGLNFAHAQDPQSPTGER